MRYRPQPCLSQSGRHSLLHAVCRRLKRLEPQEIQLWKAYGYRLPDEVQLSEGYEPCLDPLFRDQEAPHYSSCLAPSYKALENSPMIPCAPQVPCILWLTRFPDF